jgi:dihydroneopterin aldolase
MNHDEIRIIGIDLAVHIGVPEEERATLQTLQADVILEMPIRFEDLQDDLASTIDYDAVTKRMRKLASERPRKLIETLAAEMAQCVLTEFGAQRVHIELRKRILPGVDHVAVRLQRNR